MPNAFTLILLFVSSYSPLFGILALKEWGDNREFAIALVGLALISVSMPLILLKVARKLGSRTWQLTEISPKSGEIMAYIVTYIVPFVGGVQPGVITDVAAIVILFLVIGYLYIQFGLIHINPILGLAGYRIYEARVGPKAVAVVITRKRILSSEASLPLIRVSEGVYLEESE